LTLFFLYVIISRDCDSIIPTDDAQCPSMPGYGYQAFYNGPNDRDFLSDFSQGFLLPFQLTGAAAQALTPVAGLAGPLMGAAAFGK